MYAFQINSTFINPASQLSGGSLYLILIIFAVIVTIRLYRGLKGTKFSTFTLFRLPAIYTILTIFSLAAYYGKADLYEIIVAALAVFIIGVFAGLRYGSGVEFFEKEGNTHYKRAPYILIIWLVAFIARFVLEFAFPTLFYVSLVVNILLAFSTGLIAGEALHIHEKYKAHKKKLS